MKAMASISMMAAMERMELYFMAHPGSPSAVRRPRLSLRGQVWTAVLGSNRKVSVTGSGTTVEAALSDFDIQYLRALRPPDVSNSLFQKFQPMRYERRDNRTYHEHLRPEEWRRNTDKCRAKACGKALD